MPEGCTWIKTKLTPRRHMVLGMRASTECYNNNYYNTKKAKRRPRKAKRA